MDEYGIKRPLFGKEVELVVHGAADAFSTPVLDDAYQEGLRLQRIFSLYDPRSELNLINSRRSGKPSPEFNQVLSKALEISNITKGGFDITHGKSFLARKSTGQDFIPACTFRDIRLEGDEVRLTHPDVLLDMGSIAKGFIVDRMASILEGSGIEQGLVDGRGDIRVFGEELQVIGIQHPRQAGLIAEIRVSNGAVATSGDYNQFQGDFSRSHMIGGKELSSVTVIAPSLMEADAFATAIFVTPMDLREKIIEDHPHIKAFTVRQSGQTKAYNGFQRLMVM